MVEFVFTSVHKEPIFRFLSRSFFLTRYKKKKTITRGSNEEKLDAIGVERLAYNIKSMCDRGLFRCCYQSFDWCKSEVSILPSFGATAESLCHKSTPQIAREEQS